MEINTRRSFFGKLAAMAAVITGAPKIFAPFVRFMDRQIPVELLNTPENQRRAKLATRFGILGSLFGVSYASFYFLIGHLWGAFII